MRLIINRRKKAFSLMKEGILKIKKNGLVDYPSGCTENLGVVPLFLLAALRTAPIFFLLFLRIIFVFLVFDAISQSYLCAFNKIRVKVLTAFRIKVKELLPMLCVLVFSLITHNAAFPASEIKYLRVGEQFSIPFTKKSQFSVGNKKVLKTRFLKSKRQLLIKGVKAGLSDLLIWKHSSSTQYQIYVSHHGQQAQQQLFIEYLNSKQIKFIQKQKLFIIQNKIQSRQVALEIIHFCSKKTEQENIYCEVDLSSELSSRIQEEIQSSFSSKQVKEFECQINGIKIKCTYQSYSPINLNQLQNDLKKIWNISLLNQTLNAWRNYKVSFHFLEKQSSQGINNNLGGSIISSELTSLLSSKPQQGAFQNTINLQQDQTQLKTIATPVFHTSLNSQNTIRIGSEDSFTNSTSYSQQTNWKFSGFDLEFRILKKKNHLFLEYKTGMSSRQGDRIEGHQKKSSLIIELNKASTMFSIGLSSKAKSSQALPKISSLPILGRLFRSKTKNQNKTQLLGFFLVEPLNI